MLKLNVKGEDDTDSDGKKKKGQKVVSEKLLFGTHSRISSHSFAQNKHGVCVSGARVPALRDMQPPASA